MVIGIVEKSEEEVKVLWWEGEERLVSEGWGVDWRFRYELFLKVIFLLVYFTDNSFGFL